jgi:hypothetical protein
MNAETNRVPPKISAPPSLGIFVVLLLGAAALMGSAMIFLFNPATHHFYPVCLFHELTGLNCPGCGMTRSLYALLHGNVRLALKDNALFLLTLVALAVWGGRFSVRIIRHQPAAFNLSPKMLWLFIVVAFVFAVIRNLPGFEWLSP